MVQELKLLLRTPYATLECLVQGLMAPFPIQLPADAHWRAADGEPIVGSLLPMGVTQVEFLDASFSLAQS